MSVERKFNNTDCYFYYYKECRKADSCPYRHEPSARGHEIVCKEWKLGKCNNLQCNKRHMVMRKNRAIIPCYWEGQESGCQKPFCPFLHSRPRNITADTQ